MNVRLDWIITPVYAKPDPDLSAARVQNYMLLYREVIQKDYELRYTSGEVLQIEVVTRTNYLRYAS